MSSGKKAVLSELKICRKIVTVAMPMMVTIKISMSIKASLLILCPFTWNSTEEANIQSGSQRTFSNIQLDAVIDVWTTALVQPLHRQTNRWNQSEVPRLQKFVPF